MTRVVGSKVNILVVEKVDTSVTSDRGKLVASVVTRAVSLLSAPETPIVAAPEAPTESETSTVPETTTVSETPIDSETPADPDPPAEPSTTADPETSTEAVAEMSTVAVALAEISMSRQLQALNIRFELHSCGI